VSLVDSSSQRCRAKSFNDPHAHPADDTVLRDAERFVENSAPFASVLDGRRSRSLGSNLCAVQLLISTRSSVDGGGRAEWGSVMKHLVHRTRQVLQAHRALRVKPDMYPVTKSGNLAGLRLFAASLMIGLVTVSVAGLNVLVAGPASAIPSTPCGTGTLTSSGGIDTCKYTSTGGATFTVPAGVTAVTITAVGGTGGNNIANLGSVDSLGGEGAVVTASETVTASDSLAVTVAKNGGNATATGGTGGSGAGSGGNGGATGGGLLWGAGGGGASAVYLSTTPLVVAGGGGGTGGGGDGGNAGSIGSSSDTFCTAGAAGDSGGGPGTCTSPLADLVPAGGRSGGTGGTGGQGGAEPFPDAGGGGGGGYAGGGGASDAGGGGGSSYPSADVTGHDTTATPSVAISWTALVAGTFSALSGTEGSSTSSGTIASFTDVNPNAATTDFSATVDWGDGSAVENLTSGAFSQPGGAGTTFDVSATHTYAEEGTYTVNVAVSATDGSTITLTNTAKVVDASLSAGTAVNLSADEGISTGSVVVGTFTDANPTAPTTDFTATVNWGDGSAMQDLTSSAFTQPGGVGTTFDVSAAHTYAAGGTFTLTVVVTDAGGSTVTLTGSVTVETVPAAPSGLVAQAGNNDVVLHWTPAPSTTTAPVDGYDVLRGTSSGTEIFLVTGLASTPTSYTDSTAVNGTTYYYLVVATNGVGFSQTSNEASAMPHAPSGTTYYVSTNGSNSSNPCTNRGAPCLTLPWAITEAAPGATIDMLQGTYSGPITIEQNLSIVGAAENSTIISGGDAVVTVVSGTVTISNLTITRGLDALNADGAGGLDNLATLTLNHVMVSSNSSTVSSATHSAGGIYNAGTMTIENSVISSNTATGGGCNAGIVNYGTQMTIESSVIQRNVCSGPEGVGGIGNHGPLAIYQSTISQNSATNGGGGGIFNSSTLYLSGVAVTSNTGKNGAGGGINNIGTATILGGLVSGNAASSLGGGIYDQGILTMSGSGGVDSNTAQFGGGLFIQCTAKASLTGTTVQGNSAPSGGGGIYYITGTLTRVATSVTGNHPDETESFACGP